MDTVALKQGFKVLDKGYVKLIDYMGEETAIIEAARMSVGKGFVAWGPYETCKKCGTNWHKNDDGTYSLLDLHYPGNCCDNGPMDLEKKPGDATLLEFLYSNQHMTPFEMCILKFEVKAPIVVFREWHRHRTQSYNEFSARYSVMPNEHYVPEPGRIAKQSKANKQGSGEAFSEADATEICSDLANEQEAVYQNYDRLIQAGVANEIARLNTPVSRYSKMTVSTDLRNWLGFLSLRMELSAQKEIRQFANAVALSIKTLYPRTFNLWREHNFFATRFSCVEMKALRQFAQNAAKAQGEDIAGVLMKQGAFKELGEKKMAALAKKIETDKEANYADVEAFKP